MLHSDLFDLFPEFGCDGELIELPERCSQVLTVAQCAKWELCRCTSGEKCSH